ncbi:hypothetical protein PVAR5_2663 [Paecilomyces variotii No. 5]|uniref:Uncharacterized protein n=1 Tax=Byssochlamys spectabilis (strain No. 5 / NBRC 109023) TaxID=1356009 RepID=V5FPZ8_BYSSN|nr:hypothetical protein PVAR5_2663 [Paecilomyces variotii No. 5]
MELIIRGAKHALKPLGGATSGLGGATDVLGGLGGSGGLGGLTGALTGGSAGLNVAGLAGIGSDEAALLDLNPAKKKAQIEKEEKAKAALNQKHRATSGLGGATNGLGGATNTLGGASNGLGGLPGGNALSDLTGGLGSPGCVARGLGGLTGPAGGLTGGLPGDTGLNVAGVLGVGSNEDAILDLNPAKKKKQIEKEHQAVQQLRQKQERERQILKHALSQNQISQSDYEFRLQQLAVSQG